MIVKRLQDDNLKIMDNLKLMDDFEWATITLSTSADNLDSRNDSILNSQGQHLLYLHSTSVANTASRNESLSLSRATITLSTSDANLT